MIDIALRVENPCPERRRRMSKRYHIGARQKCRDTLRNEMKVVFRRYNVHTLSRSDGEGNYVRRYGTRTESENATLQPSAMPRHIVLR